MKFAHVFLAFLAISAGAYATEVGDELSIWDALNSSKDYSIFAETLDFLGIGELLAEPNTTMTLLVPSDIAFERFFTALGLEGNLTSILNAFHISALAEVIGYHFLEFPITFEEIVDNGNKTLKPHTLAGNVTVSLYENQTDSEPWVAGRTGSSQLFEWAASEEPYPAILYAIDHVLLPRKYKDFPGY